MAKDMSSATENSDKHHGKFHTLSTNFLLN